MLIESVIAALVPVGVEGIKQAIVKWTGGIRATTVDEEIKLQNAEIDRLKALAELDDPHGNPSQWVVDLRASSRYIGALVVIGAGVVCLYIPGMPEAVLGVAMEAASVCFGFLFGQRIVLSMKGK